MSFDLPFGVVARAVGTTFRTFLAIHSMFRPIWLVTGTILLAAAVIITIRNKPPTFGTKAIGPYNPAFDPLQKTRLGRTNMWRFLSILLLIFGLVPWIVELMIYTKIF